MNTTDDSIMIMEVALNVGGAQRTEWVRLRHALWGDGVAALGAQLRQLERDGVPYVGFLACHSDAPDCAIAFAEASLRRYVNGCETSPVAFLEGLYVEPSCRRQGLARRLVVAAEAWGRKAGCVEFASDINQQNHESHATHLALGFEEIRRVIYFRKSLH